MTRSRPVPDEYLRSWHHDRRLFRVVRKTDFYVFIESDDPGRTCWRLDREELEAKGSAFSRVAGDWFYLQPGWVPLAGRATVRRLPPFARALGLSVWPATVEEIRTAFRVTAKRAHPDHGGSDRAFIVLEKAKYRALSTAGGVR